MAKQRGRGRRLEEPTPALRRTRRTQPNGGIGAGGEFRGMPGIADDAGLLGGGSLGGPAGKGRGRKKALSYKAGGALPSQAAPQARAARATPSAPAPTAPPAGTFRAQSVTPVGAGPNAPAPAPRTVASRTFNRRTRRGR